MTCEYHGLRVVWLGGKHGAVPPVCADCREPVETDGWTFYWLNPALLDLSVEDDYFGVRRAKEERSQDEQTGSFQGIPLVPGEKP